MWPHDVGKPDDVRDLLMAAWIRRKKIEAKIQAVAIVNTLGEAMNPNKTQEISSDAMLTKLSGL